MSAAREHREGGRRAVCLVSGGMDSAVALAEARAAGFDRFALTFDYGQRHRIELEAAARVARGSGVVEHRVVKIDLSAIGGSALTDRIEVPKDRPLGTMGSGGSGGASGATIPATYVPARNTVFLAVALGWAEVLGARDIFLGINAVDYSGYPDCRPEFLEAFEKLARVATAAGTEHGVRFGLHAPLISMSKADIVRRGAELGVDFALTHTCYDPVFVSTPGSDVLACGRCDACLLRLRGFEEAAVRDPLRYATAVVDPRPRSGG